MGSGYTNPWIGAQPDLAVLRQGFVDALPLPLDEERFAASFQNMIHRCDLQRRLDLRENQLETYYAISDDMLWTKDMGDLHMDINPVLIALAGKPREQIEGKHENEVYGLDPDVAGCKQSELYVRTTGRMNYFEESMPGADGKLHHLRVAKAPWRDGQGRIIGSIGLGKDMTELMNQQTKFERFLDDLELGVVIVDTGDRVIQTNRVYLEIAGLQREEVEGHPLKELAYEQISEFGVRDYVVPAPNGKKTIWTCNKFDLKDYWGRLYGFTYIFHDVTLERKQEKKIRSMAVKDHLTGLSNRVGLSKYVKTMGKKGCFTFLYTDIDQFKTVNDRFGHTVGDRVLRSVAGLFRAVLPDAFTARVGGDEFFTIVSGSVGRPELEVALKALLEGIQQLPDYPEEIRNTVSFSIGVLFQSPLEANLGDIIRRSDEGMYQAKRLGKNRYCFCDCCELSCDKHS